MTHTYVRRLLIFGRAAIMVLLCTGNIYLMAKGLYSGVIVAGAGISLVWTLNVKDMAISCWLDRLAYILGGIYGNLFCFSLIGLVA
jgi:hypothetical protein